MAYYLHLLSDEGDFELIAEDFLYLYPHLDSNQLIAIDNKDYDLYCKKGDDRTRFVNGRFVYPPPAQKNDQAMLEQARRDLIYKISQKTDAIKDTGFASYPQTEIDSFYRQEQEARAWLADNSSPTPMLSAMQDNYKSMTDLCKRIIHKADLFSQLVGQLLAAKQNFEKQAEQAQSIQELQAIEDQVNQWGVKNED